jgi:cAMP phosphodiesterase
LKVIGPHGTKSKESSLSSFLIDENFVIDAGNIINPMGDNLIDIKHVLITHSHIDHTLEFPLMIDNLYEDLREPINLYATQDTINALKDHVFNNLIWPDFTNIKLPYSDEMCIKCHVLEYGKEYNISKSKIVPIKNNHIKGSMAVAINDEILLTSDTYRCENLWNYINKNKNIKKIVADVSFPSKFDKLAEASKHMTPAILEDELGNINRDNVSISVNHIKYKYIDTIKEELALSRYKIKVLNENDNI